MPTSNSNYGRLFAAKSVRAASRRDFSRLEAAPTRAYHFKMRIAGCQQPYFTIFSPGAKYTLLI
jgi:hypothetical protein